jgi:hypothetical protein
MPCNHDDIGVKGVPRLYIAVHRQAAHQTMGSKLFAGFNQPGEVSRATFSRQLVRLRRNHNFNSIRQDELRQIRKKRSSSPAGLNYQQPPDEDLGRDHHLQ